MENEFIKITKCPIDNHFTLKRNLKYFKSEFKKKKKLLAASHKEKLVLKNNEKLLNTYIK
jgi:hypothetical protein